MVSWNVVVIIIVIIIIIRFPPEIVAILEFMLMASDFLMYALCMRQEVNLLLVLGVFAELPKETIRCLLSVCLSLYLSVCSPACKNSAPTGRFS